jgi:hypothetical protein
MDEARKGERAGASESIKAQMCACSQRVSESQDHTDRSRRESNPHLRFRKPPFYPLNYGNKYLKRDKPRQGVVANTLNLFRNGAVGFIDWLDGFIDMQAHVLNAFVTAVSNDNIPIARPGQQLNFRLA